MQNILTLKKTTFFLLLVSLLGMISSVGLYLIESSFLLTAHLFLISLVSSCVFFSLAIIQRKNEKRILTPFLGGVGLVSLIVYGILNPSFLATTSSIILAGIFVLITLAIFQLLKEKQSVVSKIARYAFLSSLVLILFSLFANQTSSVYFSVVSFLSFIGTVTLLLSVLKKSIIQN